MFVIESLRVPQYIWDTVANNDIKQYATSNLEEVLSSTDVLYVTRIQKERFKNKNEYDKVKNCYVINAEVLTRCAQNMIVMHPLPRINEISTDIDDDPRAVYFKQMENGMYVRMALLALVLGGY